MYFSTKNTLKNNCNHTPKQTLNHLDESVVDMKYNNLFLCFKNIFYFFCFKLIFLNHFDI
jgi:hypothetical protein